MIPDVQVNRAGKCSRGNGRSCGRGNMEVVAVEAVEVVVEGTAEGLTKANR
jgi:hypothetical protein